LAPPIGVMRQRTLSFR